MNSQEQRQESLFGKVLFLLINYDQKNCLEMKEIKKRSLNEYNNKKKYRDNNRETIKEYIDSNKNEINEYFGSWIVLWGIQWENIDIIKYMISNKLPYDKDNIRYYIKENVKDEKILEVLGEQ